MWEWGRAKSSDVVAGSTQATPYQYALHLAWGGHCIQVWWTCIYIVATICEISCIFLWEKQMILPLVACQIWTPWKSCIKTVYLVHITKHSSEEVTCIAYTMYNDFVHVYNFFHVMAIYGGGVHFSCGYVVTSCRPITVNECVYGLEGDQFRVLLFMARCTWKFICQRTGS